jgi:Domain of unknown function (DUF6089)
MKNTRSAILVFLATIPLAGNTQNLHASVMAGLSNYNGDLHPKFYALSQSKFHVALGAKYDVGEKISLRTHISYGAYTANDKKSRSAVQKARNLNAKSKLLEWQLGAEYNIFSFNERWWTPYLFASVGLFHFNPKTVDGGIPLKALATEGQGAGIKKYKLTQFCLPIGAGFKYALNEDMRVGIEFGFRKLFTDYLDDVSGVYADPLAVLAAGGVAGVDLAWRGDELPGGGGYPAKGTLRGNNNGKDWYYFTAFTFSMRLVLDKYKRIAGLATERRPKKVGCPASKGIF